MPETLAWRRKQGTNRDIHWESPRWPWQRKNCSRWIILDWLIPGTNFWSHLPRSKNLENFPCIACLQGYYSVLQINPSAWLRLLYALRVPNSLIGISPTAIEKAIGLRSSATVVNVGSNGKIIRGFQDPTGKVIAYVTTAFEFEGNLYLGNMHTNFLGKLPLENSSSSATK